MWSIIGNSNAGKSIPIISGKFENRTVQICKTASQFKQQVKEYHSSAFMYIAQVFVLATKRPFRPLLGSIRSPVEHYRSPLETTPPGGVKIEPSMGTNFDSD